MLYIKASYADSLLRAVAQVLKPHFVVAVLLADYFPALAAVVLPPEEVELLGADFAELRVGSVPAGPLEAFEVAGPGLELLDGLCAENGGGLAFGGRVRDGDALLVGGLGEDFKIVVESD